MKLFVLSPREEGLQQRNWTLSSHTDTCRVLEMDEATARMTAARVHWTGLPVHLEDLRRLSPWCDASMVASSPG